MSATGTADHLAGVLAADGLWLPGADTAAAVAWPRDAGEAYALANQFALRQLWVHPSAQQQLSLPQEKTKPNPQEPEPHPWTIAPGFQCDPPGLAAWVNVQPDDGGRRRAVVLTAYESRAPWRAASTGKVLLSAVLQLAQELPRGCNYYYSPNQTSAAIIRHHTQGRLSAISWPLPERTRIRHVQQWSRPLSRDEEGAGYLHRYDTNGAQLAVWNVKLGLGDAVRVEEPKWTPEAKKVAGYWLTEITDGWRPDPRLPDLLIPWRTTGETQVWLPGPYLELLAEVGAGFSTPEAWLWPNSSAWLETSGRTFKDARTALGARQASDEAAALALRVVKAMYTSRIGAFSPHAPAKADELVRRDARDMVISKSFCNDYRRVVRIGRGRGGAGGSDRWPVAIYADAVYYVSDEADGGRAAPAGMVIGDALGEYSHEVTIPLDAVESELGEAGFIAAVEAFLREQAGA